MKYYSSVKVTVFNRVKIIIKILREQNDKPLIAKKDKNKNKIY